MIKSSLAPVDFIHVEKGNLEIIIEDILFQQLLSFRWRFIRPSHDLSLSQSYSSLRFKSKCIPNRRTIHFSRFMFAIRPPNSINDFPGTEVIRRRMWRVKWRDLAWNAKRGCCDSIRASSTKRVFAIIGQELGLIMIDRNVSLRNRNW